MPSSRLTVFSQGLYCCRSTISSRSRKYRLRNIESCRQAPLNAGREFARLSRAAPGRAQPTKGDAMNRLLARGLVCAALLVTQGYGGDVPVKDSNPPGVA